MNDALPSLAPPTIAIMEATFSGASDDLVHVDGFDDKYDEVGNLDGKHGFILRNGPLSARIQPHYTGTWHFSISQVDEDVPMLPIASLVDVSEVCPYSTALQIRVPAGTTIHYEGSTDDEEDS